MAVTDPTQTRTPEATAAERPVIGRLRLAHPTRGYAVTRNPFAVWAVLPLITLSFIGLAIAELVGDDTVIVQAFGTNTVWSITVVAFLIVTLGLLAIPAVALKGSINLTHDGVTFERGRDHLTAGWDEVVGLTYQRGPGLCLALEGAQQTVPSMRLPGGFRAVNGSVQIPLRMFGDRQFSILYDIRDRVPEARWLPAVRRVKERSPQMNLAILGGVVAICAAAIIATGIAVTS